MGGKTWNLLKSRDCDGKAIDMCNNKLSAYSETGLIAMATAKLLAAAI